MAKIYWFTGQPDTQRTELSEQLSEFLKSERRNWRKNVYYIDTEILDEVSPYDNLLDEHNTEIVKNAQLISSYLQKNETDVVVSLITPIKEIREKFKKELGRRLVEIYIESSLPSANWITCYEPPTDNFIHIDTTHNEVIDSYAQLIMSLRKEKLI